MAHMPSFGVERMTEVYVVGYGDDGYEPQYFIVAVYTNKQKADELRQSLQQAHKGDYQFLDTFELDPVKVEIT